MTRVERSLKLSDLRTDFSFAGRTSAAFVCCWFRRFSFVPSSTVACFSNLLLFREKNLRRAGLALGVLDDSASFAGDGTDFLPA